jgi:hypothetical protein
MQTVSDKKATDTARQMPEAVAFFVLPSEAGEPGLLKETGVTPTGGR